MEGGGGRKQTQDNLGLLSPENGWVAVFYVLQEEFSSLEIKRRWRSVAVPFGVVR